MMRLNAALYAAEQTHQAHTARGLRRWRYGLWALLLPALLTALILFWGEFAGAIAYRSTTIIADTLHGLAVYTQAFTYALYAAILLLALTRAVSSITHEIEQGTWSLLVLSHADSRSIIFSKWWATMRGLGRLLGLLIVLRAGMAVWIGAEQSRMTYLMTGAIVPSQMLPPDPVKILLTLPVIAIFTIVSIGAVAAFGVLAGAALRRTMPALAAAFVSLLIVFGLLIGISAVGSSFVSSPRTLSRQTRDFAQPYFEALTLAALDNGNDLAMRLVDYEVKYNYRPEHYVLIYNQQRFNLAWWGALISVCGLYSLMELAALRLAQVAAERAGALPPPGTRTRSPRPLPRPALAATLL